MTIESIYTDTSLTEEASQTKLLPNSKRCPILDPREIELHDFKISASQFISIHETDIRQLKSSLKALKKQQAVYDDWEKSKPELTGDFATFMKQQAEEHRLSIENLRSEVEATWLEKGERIESALSRVSKGLNLSCEASEEQGTQVTDLERVEKLRRYVKKIKKGYEDMKERRQAQEKKERGQTEEKNGIEKGKEGLSTATIQWVAPPLPLWV